jgi:hypothetical protein
VKNVAPKSLLACAIAASWWWLASLNDRDYFTKYDRVMLGMMKEEVSSIFQGVNIQKSQLAGGRIESWLIWDEGMLINKFYVFHFENGRVISKDHDQ